MDYDVKMILENVYQPNGLDRGMTPDEFLAKHYAEEM